MYNHITNIERRSNEMFKAQTRLVYSLMILVFISGCVNLKGFQNPTIPEPIGDNRYSVVIGLRNQGDLTQDMFMFCDQQKKIYRAISYTGMKLIFSCLDPDDKNSMTRSNNWKLLHSKF